MKKKALAMTISDCYEMYQKHISTGQVFFAGQQRLFDPRYIRAMEMIHAGTFGEVEAIRTFWFRNNDWRRPVPSPELERHINCRLYNEYSKGLMTELACHQIQVGSWAMRSIPNKVMGHGAIDAMHTRIDIALCNLDEGSSIILLDNIVNEIRKIEFLSNRFDPQSELSHVNRLAALNPYKISNELYSILEKYLDYKELTFGAFHITIQSLDNYRQGIKDIVLDADSEAISFNNPNVQIDLNGFIKGYALDKIKTLLLDAKCDNALMNMGNSSILALGNHPNGKGWKVNLPENVNEFVTLHNQCLTNSGNSSNHLHIINPQTAKAGCITAIISVITDNAADGEVLSTSLCVSEPELKEHICERLGGRIADINPYSL